MSDLIPIIEIGNDNVSACYYNDLSGQIEITDNKGEQIFFRDDGKLKHHIEYLNEAIEDLQKAYQTNIKAFKKAIVLLSKEQAKFKNKKAKKK